MAYIYKIENDINGKIYIGKTEFSIEKRFKEHCKDAYRSGKEQRPLYFAIRKYGVEHFHISLIEETDNPEEREIYWIEKLRSFKHGYNATCGGDGKKYVDYDLVISTYRKTLNQKTTAELLGIHVQTVRKIIKENIPDEVLSIEEINKKIFSRSVAKIDPKTNEILQVYSSVSEAERENNIPRHIGAVCKGKRKTAGGFKWEYI